MESLHAKKLIQLELLWWLVTLLLIVLIGLPILLTVEKYPFWVSNILFILTFITTTRYIFLLRFTWLADLVWIKVVVFFLAIPFVFLLIQELNAFQGFLDERGMDAVVGALPLEKQSSLITYIRSEYLLFGVGAIVGSIVLPVRLLISIWRIYNKVGV